MSLKVIKISSVVWKESFSEEAHKICFEENKPKEMDRIDFALFIVDEEDKPCGYITCREMDSDTCYWQFGGTFPGTKGTVKSWGAYAACISWSRGKYKRITTLIENTNKVMLKFAGKAGFLITGIRTYNGDVLLEHTLEFKDGN